MNQFSRRIFLIASAFGSGLLSSREFLIADDESTEREWPDNPFLQENFAPVREEITADNLKVVGRLPANMDGMFVRNGSNPQFPPKLNYHWLEGDGMLHGVRIQDGKASYQNRWVRTAAWRKANKEGHAIYPSVLDPPDVKHFLEQFLKGEMPYPNTANTALVWHHGKLLALWEGGLPHEINVPNLETVGPYNFGAKLKHVFTAHPKVDPKTGELMFFGYSPIPPFVQYSVADRHGAIKSTTPIELPRAVMMHDMAITENYSLFIDCPVVFDPTAMLREKHELGKGYVGGEGVFVPRPDAKTEDDGWLVSLTHDRVEGRSELRVVDCRDLRAAPVAQVRIPQRVPYGFHAIWLPGDVL